MKYFPLLLFFLICVALALGLSSRNTENVFTSKMIGAKPDSITLPLLGSATNGKIPPEGKVTILNIFASWCESCQVEHAMLMALKDKVEITGIAWKDKPEKIKAWLDTRGNPYHRVLMDEQGKSTMKLALSGVPETFIFDKSGTIRYNKKAPITDEEVHTVILPLLEKLHAE